MKRQEKIDFSIAGEVRTSGFSEGSIFLRTVFNKTNSKKNTASVQIQKYLKRVTDIVGAVMLLIITMPLFAVISAVIKMSSKGGIFYKQKRVGYKENIFIIYKFRTMQQTDQNEKDHQKYVRYLLKEGVNSKKNAEFVSLYIEYIESHITPVGRFLRATSLDEIPQLFNILKGDMSFVGPRPHPVYEVAEYKKWYRRRLKVKPGLTGWSKLRIRMAPENYEESILLDLWYVKNWNILLDLRIVFLTFPLVLFMKDAH
ncbi:sugar transferase [bacterium]|nr:sugar transferase [bacterium]